MKKRSTIELFIEEFNKHAKKFSGLDFKASATSKEVKVSANGAKAKMKWDKKSGEWKGPDKGESSQHALRPAMVVVDAFAATFLATYFAHLVADEFKAADKLATTLKKSHPLFLTQLAHALKEHHPDLQAPFAKTIEAAIKKSRLPGALAKSGRPFPLLMKIEK